MDKPQRVEGVRIVLNTQPGEPFGRPGVPPILPPMAMLISRQERDHVDAIRAGRRHCEHCR